MASFSFGLLIVVIITICVLALVKRYVYPIKANKWRHSTGLSRTLADIYDWTDGRGTVKRRHCTEFVEDDVIYNDSE
jgi:hypothetical protein